VPDWGVELPVVCVGDPVGGGCWLLDEDCATNTDTQIVASATFSTAIWQALAIKSRIEVTFQG
jgi:hypothetical protein